VSVLIDLGNYFTAYPRLTFSGGRNSRVSVSWAEALFEPGADGKPSPSKGNRDEVAGKLFHGLEDTFLQTAASPAPTARGGGARDAICS
jgi:alpha-L-rhamnosidase